MSEKENRLGTEPVNKLLIGFAIPSVIANLVSALYNIVDQIFIGQGVGYLGNAATNIAFPITTICLSVGLLIGIGASANFNLELGRGNKEEAKATAGTAFGSLVIAGIIICILIRIFLEPLMILFGANETTLPMTMTYAGITSIGIPFFLLSTGGNTLIRADGNAKYSMIVMVVGAILNTILDPLFIFVFDFGIAGAAWATVISQIVSAILLIVYLPKFQNVKFEMKDFVPKMSALIQICKLGINSFIFQISATLVQIASTNLLEFYGALSVYGSTIPIAAAGVTIKVNQIFISIVIGVVQGSQPIVSYNYGAKKYDRVKETFMLVIKTTVTIGVIAFFIFEIFAPQIVSLFGGGEELYMEFAVRYLRIFLFFVAINGVQAAIGTFFPSIGKAGTGAILALSKQIIILLPLMFILPKFVGIYGVVLAVPISDLLSCLLAVFLVKREFKNMPKGVLEVK